MATWAFGEIAVRKASEHLSLGESAADAAEAGVNAVERDNEDQYFVGLGGLPNAEGCMEFDAAIMDGRCLVRNPPKAMRLTLGARAGSGCRLGAVAGLQGTVCAVSVARAVMQHSPHNFLVGDGATKVPTTPAPSRGGPLRGPASAPRLAGAAARNMTRRRCRPTVTPHTGPPQFARARGFAEEPTLTDDARRAFEEWRAGAGPRPAPPSPPVRRLSAARRGAAALLAAS